MIPHTLVLKPGLVIYRIYNGYWFWGRPSFVDLWHDLRDVSSEIRPDWDLATPGLHERWDAGDPSPFHGWNKQLSEPQSDRTQTEWRPTWVLSAVLGRPETDMTDRKRTPVCELLGIELPIVEAPLSADPRLPAAVSNAGGLGTLGLGWADVAAAVVRETAALPIGRSPATSFSPSISTIESIRRSRRVCGSCPSSGAIPKATSTRCMTPGGL